MSLRGGKKYSKFVKRGETGSATESEALLVVPFDVSGGSGQDITMERSDSSTAVMGYNELSNSISVNGDEYQPNNHFILNGEKDTVYEV